MPTATTIQAAAIDNQPTLLDFTPIGRTRIQTIFDEPELSSDGGALLIREAAAFNGIIDEMVASIRDERDQSYVKHQLRELIMQRVTQICQGYEDANDCDFLKDDVAIKAATGRLPDDAALASQPTMTRLENGPSKRDLVRLFNCFQKPRSSFERTATTPNPPFSTGSKPTTCATFSDWPPTKSFSVRSSRCSAQ